MLIFIFISDEFLSGDKIKGFPFHHFIFFYILNYINKLKAGMSFNEAFNKW